MNTESQSIRIHRLVLQTDAEGPGCRAALWVQGCPIRCAGCFNTAAWDFNGGDVRSTDVLLAEIVKARGTIEGISLVGGEPFAQAAGTAHLASQCRKAGLSVVTFSGYDYPFLRDAGRPDWTALLNATDLLLAGPFKKNQLETIRPWVGSRNQEFIFLTDRYIGLKDRLPHIPNRIEWTVDQSGSVQVNGMAFQSDMVLLQNELESLGLHIREEDLTCRAG